MMFLNNKAIGLNIADHTIEVVELAKHGKRANVVSLARTVLIPGIVENGRVKDAKKLSRIIKRLLSKAQPNPIVPKKIFFALPENKVYTHVFTVEPYSKRDNIEDLIIKEAKTHIPLIEEDLLYSYEVINIYKRKGTILLVAANKQVVVEWQAFFKTLKIEVENFDIETLANYRDLFSKRPKKPVCLVDIGAATTNISIFDKRGLRYAHTSNFAGNRLTSGIAKKLKTTKEEAERKKVRYGLVTRNNSMYTALARGVNDIFKEVMQALEYYHGNNKQKISRVVLLGGSSQLKGLINYLHTNLNLPVDIGVSQLTRNSVPLEYITAIGSALRGLDNKWKKDPVISLSISEHAKNEKEKKIKAKEAAKDRKAKEKDKKKKPAIIRKGFVVNTDININEATMDEDDDDFGMNIDPIKQKHKLMMQKIILIIILFAGISGVVLAVKFRGKEKESKQSFLKEMNSTESIQIQTFSLEVPIAVTEVERSDGEVSGRLVNDKPAGATYNESLNFSRTNIGSQLKEDEVYWTEVLNPPENPETAVLPYTFNWLIYNKKELSKLLLAKIDKLNVNDTEYSLNNIENINIVKSDSKSIYLLKADVSISISEKIPLEGDKNLNSSDNENNSDNKNNNGDNDDEKKLKLEDERQEEETQNERQEEETQNERQEEETQNERQEEETKTNKPESTEKHVLILDTGIGWLNSRKGPGTNYEIVTKINTGEEFLFINEQNGWTKILLTDEQEVWVINDYIKMVQ